MPPGSKKRRADLDLEAERTLYSTFSQAANSLSQLYTQAVSQQRRATGQASRQTLERLMCFMVKAEFAASDVIPKAALFQFLQQEYEAIEGCETAPHSFPVQFLPVIHGTPSVGSAAAAAAAAAAECPPEQVIKASPSMAAAGPRGASPAVARRAASVHMDHTADNSSSMEMCNNHAQQQQHMHFYGQCGSVGGGFPPC